MGEGELNSFADLLLLDVETTDVLIPTAGETVEDDQKIGTV